MRLPILVFGMVALGAISCTKPNLDMQPDHSPLIERSGSTDSLLALLKKIGFQDESIKDLGSHYLVDGDLLFAKHTTDLSFVKSYFGKVVDELSDQDTQVVSRHQVTNARVTGENIRNIKIPNEFGDAWFGELALWRASSIQAMTHWAAIPNTSINFLRYFNSAATNSIQIIDDNGVLTNETIAVAEFPETGRPGMRIRINVDFNNNSNVSEGQRVYNIAHEIGHCIGFRHTNWRLRGESEAGSSQVLTTSVSEDPNSVMNGGTALFSWNGFSNDDRTAAATIYPASPFEQWLTSPNSGKYPLATHYFLAEINEPISITWNTALVSTPTVTLQVFRGGSLIQTIASGIPNNGNFSYPVMEAAYDNSGQSTIYEVQLRISSDADPSIFDFSPMFYMKVD